MQITESKYIELKKELHAVKQALDASLREQELAASQGDLSENEEYATSRANSERLNNRKHEIENILNEAEVVSNDSSPRISLGSRIRVTRVTKTGEPLAESREFVLDSEGDTILKGVVGVDSPLGKEILNGTDGIYFVHNNGGIYYNVEKIMVN